MAEKAGPHGLTSAVFFLREGTPDMFAENIAGFLSGTALIVAIGAQNAFVLRQGLLCEHVLPVVLVCALADVVLICAGIAGLGVVIRAVPEALLATRIAGCIFLLAYGAKAALRAARGSRAMPEADSRGSLRAALLACLGFTFLNPHVYLDTVILLGSLANQHGEDGKWRFGAGATAASFAWFFALGFGARLLTPLFRKPVAWRLLDACVALIMLGLGAHLLIGGW